MQRIKIAFFSFIIMITAGAAIAQTGNVMTLTKTITTTHTTYSSRSVMPSTTSMVTTYQFLINGEYKGSVGNRYSNLLPYFKDCEPAMKYIKKSIWQDKFETISKVSGGVLFLVGGTMLFTGQKSKTPGIVVLSLSGGLCIYGLVLQGAGERNLRRAVSAYNACESDKSKTGFLERMLPGNIAMVAASVNNGHPGIGLRLKWHL